MWVRTGTEPNIAKIEIFAGTKIGIEPKKKLVYFGSAKENYFNLPISMVCVLRSVLYGRVCYCRCVPVSCELISFGQTSGNRYSLINVRN